MISKKDKNAERLKRKARVRAKISGTTERPRLNVFRSLNHIYAQVIDDSTSKTIVACSTVEKDVAAAVKEMSKVEQAQYVGKLVAERAINAGIKTVVFDRAGYLYTGRVEALANGAREAGLVL